MLPSSPVNLPYTSNGSMNGIHSKALVPSPRVASKIRAAWMTWGTMALDSGVFAPGGEVATIAAYDFLGSVESKAGAASPLLLTPPVTWVVARVSPFSSSCSTLAT